MECYNDKDIMQEVIKIESMVRDIYDAVVEKEDKRVCSLAAAPGTSPSKSRIN